MEYTTVAKVDEIQDGGSAAFAVNGRMIAVFRSGDTFYSIDDFCPHMGASLAGGYYEGTTVTCPWHAWHFDVRDGSWMDSPRTKVDTFDVRVVGDEVQVCVPPKEQAGPKAQAGPKDSDNSLDDKTE